MAKQKIPNYNNLTLAKDRKKSCSDVNFNPGNEFSAPYCLEYILQALNAWRIPPLSAMFSLKVRLPLTQKIFNYLKKYYKLSKQFHFSLYCYSREPQRSYTAPQSIQSDLKTVIGSDWTPIAFRFHTYRNSTH